MIGAFTQPRQPQEPRMNFTLQHTDAHSRARTGLIENGLHGRIETPIFMPVGTAGTW